MKVTRATHPNLGLEAELRRALAALSAEMVAEIEKRLNPPVSVAEDSWRDVLRIIAQLREKWGHIYGAEAQAIAAEAIRKVRQHSDGSMQRALRDAGLEIKFQMSPQMQDVMNQQLRVNVEQITAVPDYLFDHIENKVRESVTEGRDIGGLAEWLRAEVPGMSKRRAAFVARHQNEQMTSQFTRVRQQQFNLKAIWLHSSAGREPRPEHKGWHGREYDPAQGMWSDVDGMWVWPGSRFNCRCASRSVIPGYPS